MAVRGARPKPELPVKICRPAARNSIVRERLWTRLDRAPAHSLVWISGPAGAGKTTLVSSYADERQLPCVWYQLDPGDTDPASFFHFLSLAARHGRRRREPPLPRFTPEYARALPEFGRAFFERLSAVLPAGSLLVFDDVHCVPAEAPLHETLLAGLGRLGASVRVVLISRGGPPPAYARLRLHQALELLGGEDLRFGLDEVEELARRHGCRPPEEELRLLQQRMDGWAAGLVLALRGNRQSATEVAAPGASAPEEVFEYFGREVFERLPAGTREFLLRTAFLPGTTAAMACELTGEERAERLLSSFHRQNVFTSVRGRVHAVYEYHPLFREFLVARAREALDEGALVELKRAAAAVLERAGRPEPAAALLTEVADWDALRGLIAGHAPRLLEEGRGRLVSEWIDGFPPAAVEGDAWLLYWRGAGRLTAAPQEARAHLERAFRLFSASTDPDAGCLAAWTGVVEAILQGLDDFADLDHWTRALYELAEGPEHLPQGEAGDRAAAGMYQALVVRNPEHPDFPAWEARALSLLDRGCSPERAVQILAHAVLAACYRGDRGAAEELRERLRVSAGGPEAPAPSRLRRFFVEAYFCNTFGAFGEAAELVRRGLALAGESGVHSLDFMLLCNGVRSALNTDRLQTARELLERLLALPLAASPWGRCFQQHLTAHLALREGRLARAATAAAAAGCLADSVGICYTEASNHVLQAELAADGRDAERALSHVERARRIAEERGFAQIELSCRLVEARSAFDGGAEDEGFVHLERALAFGRGKGGLVPYLCRPPLLADLCARAVERGVEAQYVERLIRSHGLVPTEAPVELEQWPVAVRVYTLGRFEVVRDGLPLRPTGKAQLRPLALLKLLVGFGGRRVSEYRVAEALWPDAEGDVALQALATTLHRLRRLIGPKEAVLVQEGRLSLDPRHCWVDVWAFERLLARAEEARGTEADVCELRGRSLRRALALYRGSFLPNEPDDQWFVLYRERLRSKFLRTVEALGRELEENGAWDEAVDLYRRAVETDPLAEELCRRLMLCLQRLGRRTEALAVYGRCRKVLEKVLGAQPSGETERVRRALEAG